MGISAGLLAALINNFGIPELTTWLRSRSAAGASITDADIIAQLASDTKAGQELGELWLAAHPGPVSASSGGS